MGQGENKNKERRLQRKEAQQRKERNWKKKRNIKLWAVDC
jgi:hypothetical protein